MQALATAAACYVASASPGAGPLQVITRSRVERVPDLLFYAPYVAGQVFQITDAPTGAPVWQHHDGADTYNCPEFHTRYQPCVGQLLLELASPTCASPIPVSGVLVHHADMWVNPHRLLASFNASVPWLPARGIGAAPTVCASGAELAADTTAPWHENSKALGLAALEKIQAGGERLRPRAWPAGRLCFGHGDIFYLPASMIGRWGGWAQAFEGVMHECAVPTLVHAAAAELGAVPLDTACEGHCCAFLGNPDLRASNCAHRIDFELPELRAQLRDVLSGGPM